MSYWIGPVQLVDLFEPSLTFTGSPTALGLQPGQITGQTEWWQAHQLKELVNNPARRVTIGGVSGVLEPIYFSDPMLGPLTSWCLLQSFQLGQADQSTSLQGTTGLVPYTLGLTQVGDGTQRQVVVVRSARAKGNDYSLIAHSIVVDPFGAEDFTVTPGGTKGTREYDAAHPRDLSVPSGTSESLVFYDGTISGTDQLASVVLPQLVLDDVEIPDWIATRGRDCRGIDRREEREVYGPSHPVSLTSDLGIANGLVSFWVGNQGLPPFLNLQAFYSGTWREVGCVQLDTTKSLLGARLVRVTPDEATIALNVDTFGEAFVTLKRGERLLRFQCPAGPDRFTFLTPTWSGTPPQSRSVQAINWPAKFGNGLDGGGPQEGTWSAPFPTWSGDARYSWSGLRVEPDIRLRWPSSVQNEGSTRFWYRAEKSAAALGESGFLSIFDSYGAFVGQLWMDTDLRIKFKVGSHTVQSAVQSFALNDDLMIAARWSSTNGISLSVRAPNGTVTHVSDAAAAPFVRAPFDIAYLVDFTSFGDGSLGDGEFGGSTFYPGGTIDNHGLWRRWLTDAEIVALATATYGLDKLPDPQGDLIWFAPFDIAPIVSLPAMTGGRQVDPVTDAWGFQRVIAALDAELDECAAYLARSETLGGVADQHQHFAAQFDQQVRVR
jgi:hypothetical protein